MLSAFGGYHGLGFDPCSRDLENKKFWQQDKLCRLRLTCTPRTGQGKRNMDQILVIQYIKIAWSYFNSCSRTLHYTDDGESVWVVGTTRKPETEREEASGELTGHSLSLNLQIRVYPCWGTSKAP